MKLTDFPPIYLYCYKLTITHNKLSGWTSNILAFLHTCYLGTKFIRQKKTNLKISFFQLFVSERKWLWRPIILLTQKKYKTIKENNLIEFLMPPFIWMSLFRHIWCLLKYQSWFKKLNKSTIPLKRLLINQWN